jgi:hypothetical protein
MQRKTATQTHCLLKVTLSRRRREAYGHTILENRGFWHKLNPIRYSSIG